MTDQWQPRPGLTHYLTADERKALDLAGELYSLLAGTIVGNGPTRAADLAELAAHVHAVQNAVMAQAASRAYPADLRLLGETLPTTNCSHTVTCTLSHPDPTCPAHGTREQV